VISTAVQGRKSEGSLLLIESRNQMDTRKNLAGLAIL